MDGYMNFCNCFKEDDCDMIHKLMDQYGIPTSLAVAASYSDGRWKISANMARVLIQNAIADASLHYAIWMFDEIINRNNDYRDYRIGKTVFDCVANELLFQHEIDEIKTVELHLQLIEHVGTCPDPDFATFVGFISEADTALILSDETMLVTLERARRYLKNDRTFFLVLYSAFISNKAESMLSEINIQQLITLDKLRDAGYRVKIISGTVNAFLVYPPNTTDCPANSPKGESIKTHTETDWINSRTRRSRRRKR